MPTKTIKFEVPFQQLLIAVDQLTKDEKLVLKKKLQKDKLASWQERFGRVLQYLGKKNIKFSEKEVAEDVKRAIAEVRGHVRN